MKGSSAMMRFLRSTFLTSAVVLSLATPAAATDAASLEGVEGQVGAPECVGFTADWRYTFVTNGCSSAYTVTVVYRDGTEVPCRVAFPGDRLTFPGYGTRGNEVLGTALCEADGGV
ncbi:alpha-amylase [Streptomyces sp. NBC_00080]|uniref:alpha-amylase n=2 Tax=Streptomyces TaxID=1883 RepID=UPI00114FD218|nr:alpha-amylase [Streptomyces sp. SLBN-115]